MNTRLLLRRLDPGIDPFVELWVGCVLLVLSWEWFWETTGSAFGTWHKVVGTLATVLGPLLVYHAWNRKPAAVRCDTCGKRVPIYEYLEQEPKFYALDCPDCGRRYLASEEQFAKVPKTADEAAAALGARRPPPAESRHGDGS